jgi:bifunctional non-homologous end joining protein LigD
MNAEYVEISHPEKELYPHEHLSKQDVADYYERVSPYMIPHISERPLTFKRYPKGIDDKGFFNKHAPDHFPDYIKRIDVKMRSGKKEVMQMASADETADLVYFAGQNVIEIHIGLSRADKLEKPDQLIFDFDPSDGDFEKVRTAALKLKDILDEFELPSFIKTTGSKGVHVHIPIRREADFSEAKPWAKNLAGILNEREPDLTTLEQRKNKRGDRVFIDILRNEYGQTSIAPYSLRARKGAPIATPIEWDELKDNSFGPRSYKVENIFRRLSQKGDPWAEFASYRNGTDKLYSLDIE